jgi:hypothetical protein
MRQANHAARSPAMNLLSPNRRLTPAPSESGLQQIFAHGTPPQSSMLKMNSDAVIS